eukprot:4226893-Amphidinium_carterae.1
MDQQQQILLPKSRTVSIEFNIAGISIIWFIAGDSCRTVSIEFNIAGTFVALSDVGVVSTEFGSLRET